MAILNITDRAHEFRVAITGKLSGDSVHELEKIWKSAIADRLHRELTVDISGLAGYDSAGCKLLRRIHSHGARFAASTPAALVHLREISARRRGGPVVALDKPAERAEPPKLRRAAGGTR